MEHSSNKQQNSPVYYRTEEEMSQAIKKAFEGLGIKELPQTDQPEDPETSEVETYQISFLPRRKDTQKQ